MTPFVTLEAVACPLPWPNIDTDQIIPARFMRKPRSVGYDRFLFHDRRFDADGGEIPDFPLNQGPWREAQILVAGANFGCGSSREPAVYALQDFGIRSVIAPSFGDIHRSNAIKNGLLPVTLEEEAVAALIAAVEAAPDGKIIVDLPDQRVRCGHDLEYSFEIDPFSKQCLVEGIDDIDLTLRHMEEIAAFETRYHDIAPWSLPARTD